MKKIIMMLIISLFAVMNIACAQEEQYGKAYQQRAKEYIMANMRQVSNASVQLLTYAINDDYVSFRNMLMEGKTLHINDKFTHNEAEIQSAYQGLRKTLVDNKITNLQLADEFNNYKLFGLFDLSGEYQDCPMLYDANTNQYVDIVSYLYWTDDGIKFVGIHIDKIINGNALDKAEEKSTAIIQALKDDNYDEFCNLLDRNIYIIMRFPSDYFHQISKLMNDEKFAAQRIETSRHIFRKINIFNYFWPPDVNKLEWQRPSKINILFDNDANVTSIEENFVSMDYNENLDKAVDKALRDKYKAKYSKTEYKYILDELLENICARVYFIDKGVNFYRSRSYLYKVSFSDGTEKNFVVFVDKYNVFSPKIVYISEYNENITGEADTKNWIKAQEKVKKNPKKYIFNGVAASENLMTYVPPDKHRTNKNKK